MMNKQMFLSIVGMFGAGLSYMLGGLDAVLLALIITMAIDFITGSLNAIVFKKSKKTKSGRANSAQGIRGIVKKIYILMMVVMSVQLDVLLGTTVIRDGVIVAFAAMEGLSVVENLANAGVPIPKAIKNALDILNKNEEE